LGGNKLERGLAEDRLEAIFHLDSFYDSQWEVIERLFRGERILLVKKTGFGKSLCYQFPATQFPGMTVVFSPLIALMRDQVNYLQDLGISAACINSNQSNEENSLILEQAKQRELKILYIAPERQENLEWIEVVQDMNISMVVIDEAHCISMWGHDFRPSFRRIINLIKRLPEEFPVLAATATATKRVSNDIIEQMGENTIEIRGKLLRSNFNMYVVTVENQEEKMAWLGEYLVQQEGTGIIYTGTRINTEWYAEWLKYLGIASVCYHAGLDSETRKDVEEGLLDNRWKCVVSTNALGMGMDKPDIRYIIHTQIPASPIHYYQEIGRAGRDGLPTDIILLYHPDDKELPEVFINNSRPPRQNYQKVIDALKKEPLGQYDIMRKTNLNQTQVRVICADLIDQNIIGKAVYEKRKKYEYQFDSPTLNLDSFEDLRRFKMLELRKMLEYTEICDCRMDYLCSYLDDSSVGKCGKCDNDTGRKYYIRMTETWENKINDFQESYFPELRVALQRTNLTNGVASSYYGNTMVGRAIHNSKYESGGDFPDFLLQRTLKAYHEYFRNENFDIVIYVPSTESGDLVKNFAEKVAVELGISLSHGLQKLKFTQPQKCFENWILKKENVKDSFCYCDDSIDFVGKSILLIDDVFDSGATIKEIGRTLTRQPCRRRHHRKDENASSLNVSYAAGDEVV
jgi:ATP-dependent DNA helicase RecQ